MRIADHLRYLREEQGMSQSEFADLMRVNRMTINNYETGKRIPDIDFAVRAADCFGVTVDYICGRTEYRDSEDMRTSVAKAEQLAQAIGVMPQSEGQQLLLDLSSLLEYAHEQDVDAPVLNGAINTVAGLRAILSGYVQSQNTIVQSSAELMRHSLPSDLVRANAKEKICGLSESVLHAAKSLMGTMETVGTMLQKELEKSLDDVIREYE